MEVIDHGEAKKDADECLAISERAIQPWIRNLASAYLDSERKLDALIKASVGIEAFRSFEAAARFWEALAVAKGEK